MIGNDETAVCSCYYILRRPSVIHIISPLSLWGVSHHREREREGDTQKNKKRRKYLCKYV